MPLLGQAAVAMWWDVATGQRAEFEHWHSHEHFPERLAIPGFLRGSRWASADGGEGFFVMYELERYETLTSSSYLARLNAPTPWSARMMPHHRNMVRSQCRVVASFGGGIARGLATIRLTPAATESSFRQRLAGALGELPTLAGITGAHLLQTDTPQTSLTEEQRIRGGTDRVADWIVLVGGYDPDVVATIVTTHLGRDALPAVSVGEECVIGFYTLAYAATSRDF
jgi:hypothetical protein